MEIEPKKEHWCRIVHDWYAYVVAEYLWCSKVHHHLGLLSYKAEGKVPFLFSIQLPFLMYVIRPPYANGMDHPLVQYVL